MTGKVTTIDIGAWLRGLGLGQYEAAFRENEISEKVLPSLTAEDLKELGVRALGHRRVLLDANPALRASFEWECTFTCFAINATIDNSGDS
jgi:hypothetical protein